MAETAYATQYRDQIIDGFEQGASYFRSTVTTEFVREGNSAVFLVADTGGAAAVTRGVNGLIPARADNLNQNTAVLEEWHDKPRVTKFNVFASQASATRIRKMQSGTIKVVNRKADDIIITALTAGTINTGASATMSLSLAAQAQRLLGEADVDIEDEENIFGALSPAAMAYMIQVKEFASSDYVDVKPFVGPAKRMRRWMGVNWFMSNRLSGRKTATEKLLMWHRDAIGFALDTEGMDVKAGYDEEDSYSWARCSGFMGAKLLQNAGVVVINHNGT